MTIRLITMYDDTNISVEPLGAAAYAAYVDGRFANYDAARARFRGSYVLPISVFGHEMARCLDIEAGDASPGDFPPFYRKVAGSAIAAPRPVAYHSVSGIDQVVAAASAAGIARGSYHLWSAHYGAGPHLCGPGTCGLSRSTADATQFTDTALGRSLDETIAEPYFIPGGGPGPPPAPAGQEVTLEVTMPLLQDGSHDQAGHPSQVRFLQTALNFRMDNAGISHHLTVDGAFGPATRTAVQAYQRHAGLSADGVVGARTWEALLTR